MEMSPCGMNNQGKIELLWILKVEFRNLIFLSRLELVSHFNWLHVTFLSTFTLTPYHSDCCCVFMEPPNFLKLCFLLILLICVISADEKDSTKHDVFDELTRSESYDKRIVPIGKDGNSLTVGVTLYVLKIVDITETG